MICSVNEETGKVPGTDVLCSLNLSERREGGVCGCGVARRETDS